MDSNPGGIGEREVASQNWLEVGGSPQKHVELMLIHLPHTPWCISRPSPCVSHLGCRVVSKRINYNKITGVVPVLLSYNCS